MGVKGEINIVMKTKIVLAFSWKYKAADHVEVSRLPLLVADHDELSEAIELVREAYDKQGLEIIKLCIVNASTGDFKPIRAHLNLSNEPETEGSEEGKE